MGRVRWVGLTLEYGGLGWVGNVPNPGNPANMMKVLTSNCDLGVSLVLKIRKRVPLAHQLSELSYDESEPEDHFAGEDAQERELISPTPSASNTAAPPVTRKMKTTSSVIMGLRTSTGFPTV